MSVKGMSVKGHILFAVDIGERKPGFRCHGNSFPAIDPALVSPRAKKT